MSKKMLVTGAAGFVGMHVTQILLKRGDEVIGIDNLDNYSAPNLKRARLQQLQPYSSIKFIQGDIFDRPMVEAYSSNEEPKV